jgi:hypothetical protein
MSVLLKAVAWLAAAVLVAVPAAAQETGHGDLFGDLYHILRSPTTGQPILQQKTILLPGDVPGIGYCPIPVDAAGVEIPLLPDSCEVDPTQAARLVEVDYFGRLSGGRTREVNLRMHFDEVIETIMAAEVVTVDPAGRLQFGTDCTAVNACASWKVVDSPLENMALYYRLMKYGHIQTDPLEEDTSFHGDPVLGTVYHPALRAEDWVKFTGVTTALLPQLSASSCFTGTTFNAACALPQSLTAEDFVRAASFYGGAADKHGQTTIDLLQYLNRILKITQTTALSAAAVDTLPTLIRDENGIITPGGPGMPAPADELFVNYAAAAYDRYARFNMTAPLLVSTGVGVWTETPAVSILPFLDAVLGPVSPATGIDAFAMNAADAQRAIEFVHEYAIPVNLYPGTTPPPPPPISTCSTPDPFVSLGGGTCCNGDWLPPGMVCTIPTPPPPPSTVCTTPDPFVSLGGGTCCNGSWLPPGMVCTVPTPPPPPSDVACTTPDPFVSLGGGTCCNGAWLPPGMVCTIPTPETADGFDVVLAIKPQAE